MTNGFFRVGTLVRAVSRPFFCVSWILKQILYALSFSGIILFAIFFWLLNFLQAFFCEFVQKFQSIEIQVSTHSTTCWGAKSHFLAFCCGLDLLKNPLKTNIPQNGNLLFFLGGPGFRSELLSAFVGWCFDQLWLKKRTVSLVFSLFFREKKPIQDTPVQTFTMAFDPKAIVGEGHRGGRTNEPVLSLANQPPAPFFSFQAMDSARLASKEGGLSRGTGGLMTQAGFWEG